MSFVLLILLTAFFMEAVGTWLSIIGFGSLFSGDIAILMMIGIFDLAKIVTVSFLYQYWKDIGKLMRNGMVTASMVLMLFTSAGTFGYLSQAFQKATAPAIEVTLKVDALKHEKVSVDAEIDRLNDQKAKINEQIAKLPDNVVAGRRQLINSFKPEQAKINERLDVVTKRSDELNQEVRKVESENVTTLVHVGPISYVSKAFGMSMEDASKWIILMIIFVFDPLAVMLVIAGNFLVKRKKELAEVKQVEIVEPAISPAALELKQADAHRDASSPVETKDSNQICRTGLTPEEITRANSFGTAVWPLTMDKATTTLPVELNQPLIAEAPKPIGVHDVAEFYKDEAPVGPDVATFPAHIATGTTPVEFGPTVPIEPDREPVIEVSVDQPITFSTMSGVNRPDMAFLISSINS